MFQQLSSAYLKRQFFAAFESPNDEIHIKYVFFEGQFHVFKRFDFVQILESGVKKTTMIKQKEIDIKED